MKNLSFEELEKAHKANNMFYLGTLSTGHIVFARIESTNFFEGEPDYSKNKGFRTEKLMQLKVKELKELGLVPTRNCEPTERAREKYSAFYTNQILSKLTNKNDPTLVMSLDSEFYQQYRVISKTEEVLFESFNEKEAKEYLRKHEDCKTIQNYEILTSLACSLYMQGTFCTFNIISPIELINKQCSYEEMPKIDMEELLLFIFEKCGIDLCIFSKKSIDTGKLKRKSKTLNLCLLAHNGRAEWNKFKWFNTIEFDKKGNLNSEIGQPVMNYISQIQGGDITVNEFSFLLQRTPNKFQNCRVFIADTMSLVDQGHKKLDSIGKLTTMGEKTQKVHISPNEIKHMDKLLIENPEKYIHYAIQDTIVPLVYVANLYGVNMKPDITLLTGGQRVVEEQLKQLFQKEASSFTERVKQFVKNTSLTDKNGVPIVFTNKDGSLTRVALDILYRGLIPEHKKTKNNELPLYEKNGLIALNSSMRSLILMGQRAYKGGENFCQYISVSKNCKKNFVSKRPKTRRKPERKTTCEPKHIFDKTLFYDLDIPSAYPTCIYPVCAVNVLEPISYMSMREITIDGSTKEGKVSFNNLKRLMLNSINKKNKGNGKALKKFDLGIPCFVEIKECITPKGVRPLLSGKLKGENVPVNPQHFKLDGNVQQNNTFTFLELQQCIDMGCKVVISKILCSNPVFDDKGELFRPLGLAIVEIIQMRKQMAKLYGKKSLPALICKLIANGVYYGKTAQNCIPTKTYSPIDNEEESIDRGPSRLTHPVYASYITAGTRCILACAGYAMFKHGYVGWLSQTTDGGITVVAEFLVNKWCKGNIADFFKGVRADLSLKSEGKEDNRLFVMKHVCQELYNFTTRGNVGFCYDKEIQVPVGYKHEKEESRGYVYETYYVEHLLSETEKQGLGEDYIVDGVCAMQGFKSEFGYEKGSEDYKEEIVEAYLHGMRREQINTYKPESLTVKQKEQIHKPKDEEREFPMSTMQKSYMKMNFDYKSIPCVENSIEVEINDMNYMVGWARPPKDFAEAMSYRKITKNMTRALRNAVDFELVQERVESYEPLTKKRMQLLLEGYKLGLVENIPLLDKLKGVERLEFINDFVKNDELTILEMQNCYKVERCVRDQNEIENAIQRGLFDKTINCMKEVGKD